MIRIAYQDLVLIQKYKCLELQLLTNHPPSFLTLKSTLQ